MPQNVNEMASLWLCEINGSPSSSTAITRLTPEKFSFLPYCTPSTTLLIRSWIKTIGKYTCYYLYIFLVLELSFLFLYLLNFYSWVSQWESWAVNKPASQFRVRKREDLFLEGVEDSYKVISQIALCHPPSPAGTTMILATLIKEHLNTKQTNLCYAATVTQSHKRSFSDIFFLTHQQKI